MNTRRQFLQFAGGGFAAAWAAFHARALADVAAPRPPLRLGVVSDIHIRNNGKTENDYVAGSTGTFRAALEYFRERRVDAVVIAGDMADTGKMSELDRVGQVWREVFPDCKGLDGVRVEPIFVYGNHDRLAWKWPLRGGAAKDPEKVAAACVGGEKGRVLLYEIRALAEGREVGMWRLAQELHFHPLGRVPTASRLVIGADEVPAGAVTFRVTPVGFFHKGEPIKGMLQAK